MKLINLSVVILILFCSMFVGYTFRMVMEYDKKIEKQTNELDTTLRNMKNPSSEYLLRKIKELPMDKQLELLEKLNKSYDDWY